jgi:hypothetical protein
MHSLLADIFAIHEWDWVATAGKSKRAFAFEPRDPVALTKVAGGCGEFW